MPRFTAASTIPQNYILEPNYVASAYQVPAGTGSGMKVGIIDNGSGGFLQSDLNSSMASLGLTAPIINHVILDTATGNFNTTNPSSADIENTLDVFCVAGIAPAASITLYTTSGETINDVNNAFIRAVNDGCDVITCSWSYTESSDFLGQGLAWAAYNNVPVVVSTGDWGSNVNDIGVEGVAYPASSPLVIAVGGSTLYLQTAPSGALYNPITRLTETYGGNGFLGGGGVSSLFGLPSWQSGLYYTPFNTTTGPGTPQSLTVRGIPDISVAMNGVNFYLNGSIVTAGGTSMSAPMFAAMLARLKAVTGTAWSSAQWNTFFYNNKSAFYDVASGNNDTVAPVTSGYVPTSGWDPCTGIGVPNFHTLYNLLTNTQGYLTVSPSTASLPSGNLYSSYSTTLSTIGGNAPYNYSISSGSLPAGLTLSSSGTISGTPTTPGNYSFTISVSDSTTPVALTTTVTYSISILAANNANLSALTISQGTLTPSFASTVTSYTDVVGNNITSLTITPTTSDTNATVKINGTPVTPGVSSSPINLSTGSNSLNVLVTAQDGITTRDYVINVTRSPVFGTDSSLSALYISTGTLAALPGGGGFDSNITSYTDAVGSTVTRVTVTPFTNDPNATVKVNGTTVVSGTTSTNISLTPGSNVITITVTAQNGTSITNYVVNVVRAALSRDASLLSLSVSEGQLKPTFLSSFNGPYNDVVSSKTSSLLVTAVSNNPNVSSININGVSVGSGAPTPVALISGNNTIPVVVTAEDSSVTRTYTLVIKQDTLLNDATLSALSITNGIIMPMFDGNINSYTATVSSFVTATGITPVVSNPLYGKLMVNGVVTTSGSTTIVGLTIGLNTFPIEVTAEDQLTTNVYTLVVNRVPLSKDATLSNLSVSTGTLTPVFTSTTFAYVETVPWEAHTLTVFPTPTQLDSTILVNGTTATGSISVALPNIGINAITIGVTAPSGVDTQTYTIDVNRLESADATLSSLTVSNSTISPAFSSTVTTYFGTVSNLISSVSVTPTVNQPNAAVSINGVSIASGQPRSIPVSIGNTNSVEVLVIAQNGVDSKLYSVTLDRLESSDSALSNLTASTGTIVPAFTSTTTSYVIQIPFSAPSVRLTPTAEQQDARIYVNGVYTSTGFASQAIPVALGTSIPAIISVTSQDGTTSTQYDLTLSRALGPNDATLSSLTLSNGALDRIFNPEITGYTNLVSGFISSITVTPTVNQANATVTVNGQSVTSGTPSQTIPLSTGTTEITVTVVSGNNNVTNNYVITVVRPSPSDATLSNLEISNGTLVYFDNANNLIQGFNSNFTSYNAWINSYIDEISVTPFSTDPYATVLVNEVRVPYGTACATIPVNTTTSTIITVEIASEDFSSEKFYTVYVYSSDPRETALLDNLVIANGNLSPSFTPKTLDYTANVNNVQTEITLYSSSANRLSVNGVLVNSGIPVSVSLDNINTPVDIQVANTRLLSPGQSNPQYTTENYKLSATRVFTVTSGAITSGIIHKPYTYSFNLGGGVPPIVSTITSGSLPNGLSLVNGVISGTPTQSGTYNFSVNFIDSSAPLKLSTYADISLLIIPAFKWITTSSDLGVITPTASINPVQLQTTDPTATFQLISGSLPSGLSVSSSGLISGQASNGLGFNNIYKFTVRATSIISNEVIDKTFTLFYNVNIGPQWFTPALLTSTNAQGVFIDHEYVSIQLTSHEYYPNLSLDTITYSLADILPNNLTLSSTGLISGFLDAHTARNAVSTFTFAIVASDGFNRNTQTFTMNVINANVTTSSVYTATTGISTILPTIQEPEFLNVTNLGVIKDNANCYISLGAYDPYPSLGPVVYSALSSLPLGLTLDSTSGYLHGYIGTQTNYFQSYHIPIGATKYNTADGTTTSSSATYVLSVIQSNSDVINWNISTSTLGTLVQGQPSYFTVAADHLQTQYGLWYSAVGGNYGSSGLALTTSGNIVGTPEIPGSYSIEVVATTGTTFTPATWASIIASGNYSIPVPVSSAQTFNFDVESTSLNYTNIYLTTFLKPSERSAYHNFISNSSIFVPELIYRPDDKNFGVQKDIKLYLEYGIQETTLDNYAKALYPYFTKLNLVFNGLTSYTVRDALNNSIYDVVYLTVKLSLVELPSIDYNNNAAPVINLTNMRTSLKNILINAQPISFNKNLTPLWQQNGFRFGVVLCYAKADQGQKIVNRINEFYPNMPGGFNSIVDFTVDRLVIENTVNTYTTGSSYLLFPN